MITEIPDIGAEVQDLNRGDIVRVGKLDLTREGAPYVRLDTTFGSWYWVEASDLCRNDQGSWILPKLEA